MLRKKTTILCFKFKKMMSIRRLRFLMRILIRYTYNKQPLLFLQHPDILPRPSKLPKRTGADEKKASKGKSSNKATGRELVRIKVDYPKPHVWAFPLQPSPAGAPPTHPTSTAAITRLIQNSDAPTLTEINGDWLFKLLYH